jgi:hypothetical protein
MAEGFVRSDQAIARTTFVLLALFSLGTVLTMQVSPGRQISLQHSI